VGYNLPVTSRRVRSLIVTSLISMVLLSGCLRTEVTFDVTSLETTDVSLLVAVDVAALTAFASTVGDEEDVAALEEMSGEELLAEIGDGEDPCSDAVDGFEFEVSSYAEGDYRGVICTARGVSTSELMAEFFGDAAALREGEASGTWVLEGRLSDALGLTEDVEEAGELADMFDPSELLQLSVTITAPGMLLEHNGTSASGGTVTWTVTNDAQFMEGPDAVLRAVWNVGSGSNSGSGSSPMTTLIVIGSGVLIAVAVVLLAGRLRLKKAITSEEGEEVTK
jgi:hypothetical protein